MSLRGAVVGGALLPLLLAAIVATAPRAARASGSLDGPENEYLVKAAFLFNFAKFVTWPKSAFADESAPLVIGVLGPDPFGAILEKTLEGKRIEKRPIEIRRFATAAEARRCHILFVSPSLGEDLEDAIKEIASAPVLTVGDTDGFARKGGIIQLFVEAKKLKFDASAEAAKRAGLSLSSQLLKLAVPADGQRPGRREKE